MVGLDGAVWTGRNTLSQGIGVVDLAIVIIHVIGSFVPEPPAPPPAHHIPQLY